MQPSEYDDFDPVGDPIKCITFDKAAQYAIPPEIRARMDADRKRAQDEQAGRLKE